MKTTIPTPMPNLAPAVKMPAVAIHDTPYGKLIKHFKKSTPDAERNRYILLSFISSRFHRFCFSEFAVYTGILVVI